MDTGAGTGGFAATSNLALCLTVKIGTTIGHTTAASTDKSAICFFNETMAAAGANISVGNWDSFQSPNVANWQKLALVKPSVIAAATSTA